MPADGQNLKLPLTSLRKSLNLLVDDADIENDVSYVYSGYAPLSIRLIQCVVQKGSLLRTNNPAPPGGPAPPPTSDEDAELKRRLQKVRAHPIVGWKGFEDIVASFPGEVFDVLQTPDGQPIPSGGSTSGGDYFSWKLRLD